MIGYLINCRMKLNPFLNLPEGELGLTITDFQIHVCFLRCSDSTECGTHFSSILCPSCRQPVPPLERAGQWVWQCQVRGCAKEVSEALVNTMRDRMEADVQGAEDPEDLEDILEK